DLAGANLTGADLTWANLFGADLTDANLANATLRNAELGQAKLTGAAWVTTAICGPDSIGECRLEAPQPLAPGAPPA
ncbi:MAG: pentapeptide repeat-containing protein, partial [Geminicoccaceae bacterium]